MFDSLSDRLSASLKTITGKAKITEDNIDSTLKEVRKALLEADVALPVAKAFIAKVKTSAMGMKVPVSMSPGQAFLKLFKDELTGLMSGGVNEPLNLGKRPPAVILMAGLQGAGKTTHTAKLAKYFKERLKKEVMLVSVDVYRPAAIKQLQTLAEEIGVDCYETDPEKDPVTTAKQAIVSADRSLKDVIIVDTAGRLAIDEEMMSEIKALQQTVKPVETLFVVDAMTGQDAANTAKAFDEAIELTGVILSKADGDARGGAALSVKYVTGKPIKFMGMGEKVDALEVFHPDRVASRILGMGDMMSLIEDAEHKLDKGKAEKMANKLQKGKGFNFEDLLAQFQQMKKLGGMSGLMGKMPGMGNMAQAMQQQNAEGEIKQMESMILSMTQDERKKPELIDLSRKKRIAKGSGKQIEDVNRLIKMQKDMQKMMKKFMKGGKMKDKLRGMQSMMGGKMPPM